MLTMITKNSLLILSCIILLSIFVVFGTIQFKNYETKIRVLKDDLSKNLAIEGDLKSKKYKLYNDLDLKKTKIITLKDDLESAKKRSTSVNKGGFNPISNYLIGL